MSLLLLAPDIQEVILFLPQIGKGPDTLSFKDIGRMAKEANWNDQRRRMRRSKVGGKDLVVPAILAIPRGGA